MRNPRQLIQVLRQVLQPDESTTHHVSIARRDFLKQSALLSGSILFPLRFPIGAATPSVAIIGGGLAGLSAAYLLRKAGIYATIYEAQDRIGGRVISAPNLLVDGLVTELGGEFIDSSHTDVLSYCREFQLPLLDRQADPLKNLIPTDYYLDGRRILESEIVLAFSPFSKVIQADIKSLPDNLTRPNPAMLRLDHLSIDEYLQRKGLSGWLYDLIRVAYTSEFGLLSGEQTCLNLLLMLKPDINKGQFLMYGESDERYKIAGGNELLVHAFNKHVESQLKLGFQLNQVRSNNKGYLLTFDNGKVAKADKVLITLPFSVLRQVEFVVELPKQKHRCIQELGYGTQSKLLLGFTDRLWRQQGFSGYLLSDHLHNGWDSSQLQVVKGAAGSYTLLLGANKGVTLDTNQVEQYLDGLDEVYPGSKVAFNGRKILFNWYKHPFSQGAYACYKTGQMTSFAGLEGKPINQLYFAGEHCSINFQGYMNGSLETARKAVHLMLTT